MAEIYSVSQINLYIQSRMEQDERLSNLCIRGEISNYKVYPSGHHYFSLKDASGALRCVLFKSSAVRLRFRPENGMKVLATGRISVFPRDGCYQLYCVSLTPDGVGDLYVAFEQLKEKLAQEGLFAPERKKPLPPYPGTIAVITSPAGAAVHDMLRILRKRYPLSKVRILGVRVQGVEAPPEICGAIRYVNRWNLADLIITGRGGGSMEDLWAFNDERVARTIAASRIPVISAVGHEPDVTIADYVADLRAATPSNAAELVAPDQQELRKWLRGACSSLTADLQKRVNAGRRSLRVLSGARPLQSPTAYLDEKRMMIDGLQHRLGASALQKLEKNRRNSVALASKLDAMSPLKVLTRGYAMAQLPDGTLLSSVSRATPGQAFTLRLADGQVQAAIREGGGE